MHAVVELRSRGVPVFYTIDAGPQLKAICLPEAAQIVSTALENTPGVLRLISGGLGAGAVVVNGPQRVSADA
jgi:diphosphomevalonate decarboxylase